MKAILLGFFLGILVSAATGCSHSKIMKNCKHLSQDVYECEKEI